MNLGLQGISIFLIGMMGTGKTTLGQQLAKKLSYSFIDTDEVIEKVTQHKIADIFIREGESHFREIESQILAEVCAYTKAVVATGGGIILKPENWSYLRHGLIIWLDVPVEVLLQRLAEDTTRPLLQEADPKSKLESLLHQRRSRYAQADLHILIEENQTPEQIVIQMLEQIPTVIKSKIT